MSGDSVERRSKPSQSKEVDEEAGAKKQTAVQRSKPSQSKEGDEEAGTKNQTAQQRSKPSQSKEVDEEGGTKNQTTQQGSKPSQSKEIDEEGGSKTTGLLFDDDSIRAGFVRKVFLILIAMLLVNIAMCAAIPLCEPLKLVISESFWVNLLAVVIFMATYFVLVSFQSAARNFPLNITLLVIFTLAAGVLLMAVCASVPPYTVLLALIATAVTCVGIVAYASQTLFDITSKIFIIYAVTLVVFVFGICIAITSIFVHIRFLGVLFSAIVCVLFMVHLALDIQMILGGRKYELSPEDYIYATLMLFVDIYEIFVSLVDLIDAAR